MNTYVKKTGFSYGSAGMIAAFIYLRKIKANNLSAFICANLRPVFVFVFLFFLPSLSYSEDFSATAIGDYGNITVMEVAGNYDAGNPDGSLNMAPRQEIAKEFYETHKDEYDFIVIYTNFDFQSPDEEEIAFYSAIRNDTEGIGLEIAENFRVLLIWAISPTLRQTRLTPNSGTLFLPLTMSFCTGGRPI